MQHDHACSLDGQAFNESANHKRSCAAEIVIHVQAGLPSKHDGTDAGSTGFVTFGTALVVHPDLCSGRHRMSMGSDWFNVLERLPGYSQLNSLNRIACLACTSTQVHKSHHQNQQTNTQRAQRNPVRCCNVAMRLMW